MGLFSKTLMQWQEPVYFVTRERTFGRWLWQGVWALVISIAIFIYLWWFWRGQQFGIFRTVVVSMLAGPVWVVIGDLMPIPRTIHIKSDAIQINSPGAGFNLGWISWPRKKIHRVEIQSEAATGKSYGRLVAWGEDVPLGAVGIPSSVLRAQIADTLSSLDIPVSPVGWEWERPTVRSIEPAPDIEPVASVPQASATVWSLAGTGETGLTRRDFWVVNIFQNLLSALVLFGALAFAARALWAFWMVANGPSGILTFEKIACAIAVVVIYGSLDVRYAHVFPNRYLNWRVRCILRNRPDRLIEPDDQAAFLVEVIPRQNWGRLMLTSATDWGLLASDRRQERLVYEGVRERWSVPVASIASMPVECAAPKMPDGSDGKVRTYLVVLKARQGNQIIERPLHPLLLGFESRAFTRREAIALRLREEIESGMERSPVLQ
jgi:hypothetical protein